MTARISRMFSRVSLAVTAALLFLSAQIANADSSSNSSNSSDVVGAVFVATNAAPFDEDGNPQYNSVLMFQQHTDGSLTAVPGSPFSTLGQGTGTGFQLPPDPIGSQGSLIVDAKSKFLYVVNTGSNEVSVFKILEDGLTHIQNVSSGGVFPNSLTIRNNILYVLNAAGHTNFTGFKVHKDGKLTCLPSAQCDLLKPLNDWQIVGDGQPLITEIPGQIGFSPDGTQLVITRKEGITSSDPFSPLAGPGHIDVYALDKKGLPVNCKKPTSNISQNGLLGRFPFSFIFSEKGDLVVTEIFGSASYEVSPFGASAASSYKIKSNGTLEVITQSLPNEQTATCWNARSGKFMYTSNNLSNSLSLYKVHGDGTLELLDEQIVLLGNPVPGFPLDMDISADGRFLYLLSEGVDAAIYAYIINKTDGSLTLIDIVSVGASFGGQAGLAVANFRK